MYSFRHFLASDIVEEYKTRSDDRRQADGGDEHAPWMPRVLSNFLFHLSGPSDPLGMQKKLTEATLIDNRNKPTGSPVRLPPNMVRTQAHLDKAHEEGLDAPGRNLHKEIRNGVNKAFDDMSRETPEETKNQLKKSKEVYERFAQSRGLKTTPSMLRGNLKTEKSSGQGVLTTGLNLAPHTSSGLNGFDVCPKRSSECTSSCLGTTAGGNKQYPDTALSSKTFRTHFLAAHPEHAARIIDHEISRHKEDAKKKGMIPGVRMNVTSDLPWEKYSPKMFERHKDVQFYDYTKLHHRVDNSLEPPVHGSHFNSAGHPRNYHLTLSHTGTDHSESNDPHVARILSKGGVVASVMQRGKTPATHMEDVSTGRRYPIANGDDDDNTFDRHEQAGKKEGTPGHGVVSGLKLKGIKNEDAGMFANKVDDDGIIRINKPRR